MGTGEEDADRIQEVREVQQRKADWDAELLRVTEEKIRKMDEERQRKEAVEREAEEAEEKRRAEEDELAEESLDLTAARTNLVRDILWVYERMDDRRVTKKSAPSRGAWWLLTHVRANAKNKDRFVHGLLVKAAIVQDKRDHEEAGKDAVEDVGLDDVERLLGEVEKGMKDAGSSVRGPVAGGQEDSVAGGQEDSVAGGQEDSVAGGQEDSEAGE